MDKINVFFVLFGWVWFGLSDWVWFGLVCLFHRQTNKLNEYLILINLICEFVFGYSTDKQTNVMII